MSVARTYDSPEGNIQAIVAQLPPQGYCISESKVSIDNARGERLAGINYASGAQQADGYAVERAAWTTDGRYFVYGLTSSGGHSPWHFPVVFYNCRRRMFSRLDGFVSGPGVAAPQFELRAPSTVGVLDIFGKRESNDLNRASKRLDLAPRFAVSRRNY